MTQNKIKFKPLVLDPVFKLPEISIGNNLHLVIDLFLQCLNTRIVRVGDVVIAKKQQHRLHLQIKAELRQADNKIRIAVNRNFFISKEQMCQIGQCINSNTPFTDKRFRY